jgi:hypothetical protein
VEDSDPEAGSIGRSNSSDPGDCRVILWDQHPSDCQKIGKITEGAGAHPVFVEEVSDLRLVQCCAECCVAVVVTGSLPDGVGMQAIRDLKAKGFKVIACEEGTGVWPIKTKCLPLLAGAVQLLDTSSAEFARDLRQLIERSLRCRSRLSWTSRWTWRPAVSFWTIRRPLRLAP